MTKKTCAGIFSAGLLIFMVAGMTAAPALAQEKDAQVRNVNLNRDGKIAGIADPESAGSSSAYWSGDYVHFGNYQGNTIRWRVLDANTKGVFHEKETMLLWADAILEEMPFRRDYWEADSSEWRASDIRAWLEETLFPGFEEGEQAAIAFSTKASLAEDETQPEDRVFAPLEHDRLFLLDAAEVKSAYGFGTSRARGIGATWWTRSAIGSMYNHQGAFCRIGNAVARGGYEGNIGVVPAFNLDLSRVAFVSKGLVRKASAFVRTEDGEGIGMWNLTLTDGEGFAARRSSKEQVGAGDEVAVEVTALASGSSLPYTQISAMLTDPQGTVLAYGKISDELQTGTVGFTIPEGIPEGRHTLRIFEERVEEGSDLIQTDYASNMVEIPLTVGEPGEGGTEITEPETKESETEAPESETKESETEAPEPETKESETEVPEPETKESETEVLEPETKESETEVPEPETKESETEVPEPETKESETEVPESETKESETETPEPETKESETETPEPETKESETEVPEPETKESETEALEPETKESETETPESETKESETEITEPETKESEIEAPEPGTKESEIETPEPETKEPETGKAGAGAGNKRPARPKIAKIIRRGRTFCVRWKRPSQKVNGFQIQFSTSKRFKGKRVCSACVRSGKAVQKRITRLKIGKKYFVRMRAFRKEKGRKCYSLWSRRVKI